MTAYDVLCLIICVFAVFGGYIALHIAANAALRRASRRENRDMCDFCPRGECGKCGEDCGDRPEKRTDGDGGAKKD